MKTNKFRVLIVAAACHPDKGSEPGVGFTWVRALAEYCEIDVICGEKEGNKEAIFRELKTDAVLSKNVKFFFIPRDQFMTWEKMLIGLFYPFYYRKYQQWMLKAYNLAERLVRDNKYDLTHQLTMIGYREPGYLWRLDLPFVWGPVGGNGNVPRPFLEHFDSTGRVKHIFRSFINYYQIRYKGRVKKAFKSSSAIISANSYNQDIIKKIYNINSDVALISPTLSPHPFAEKKLYNSSIKFVCSGQLHSSKNLPTIINALSKANSSNWTLDILGDGPCFKSWKKLSENLGINEKIRWHGQLTKVEAIKTMSKCDVLLFPSLIEGSPGVVSEALSMGLPVMCFEKDGQKDIVNNTCGLLIQVKNPLEAVRDFTIGVNCFLNETQKLEVLSVGALERAKKFTVEMQAPIFLNAYKKSLKI